MKKKKIKELIDIDIDEISLVDRPANKRKFLLLKRDNIADEGGNSVKGNLPKELLKSGTTSIPEHFAKCVELYDELEKMFEERRNAAEEAADGDWHQFDHSFLTKEEAEGVQKVQGAIAQVVEKMGHYPYPMPYGRAYYGYPVSEGMPYYYAKPAKPAKPEKGNLPKDEEEEKTRKAALDVREADIAKREAELVIAAGTLKTAMAAIVAANPAGALPAK